GRRAAQVDVDITVVDRRVFHVVGYIPGTRVPALRIGHHRLEGEALDVCGIGFQRLDRYQVFIIGHAVDQVNRLAAAAGLEVLQHGQEGRQTGATGQHQQRTAHRAQVEDAHRAGQRDLV